MRDTATAEAQDTGYEDAALAALGLTRLDDPDYRRPVLDAGTKVRFGVNGFEAVTAQGQNGEYTYINGKFDFIDPAELSGESLDERFSCNSVPKNAARPQNTGMAMTITTIARVVAAIHNVPVKSPEVKEFFAGLGVFKDDVLGAFVPELLSRLNDLVGKEFDTEVGVGVSLKGAKFNTLGVPVYPDPDNQRPRPKDESATK